MKTEFTATPEDALRGNAKQLMQLGQHFAASAMRQAAMCRHNEDVCPDCRRAADDMHYLAVALGVIGGAAIENQAAELYKVLTNFAVGNLPEFPKGLARTSLYGGDADFSDFIEETEATTTDGA